MEKRQLPRSRKWYARLAKKMVNIDITLVLFYSRIVFVNLVYLFHFAKENFFESNFDLKDYVMDKGSHKEGWTTNECTSC